MQLVRTTLRLKPQIKKEIEKIAVQEDTTMQELFNTALEEYLDNKAATKAKQILFKTHTLGEPLDQLSRKDYYKKSE